MRMPTREERGDSEPFKSAILEDCHGSTAKQR
jgi:hypothetical protein